MATAKQLRQALNTLMGYHQVQDLGADGKTALTFISNHIIEMEKAEQPKQLCFKDIAPGTRFQAMHLGKYPGNSTDLVYLKIKNDHEFIAGSGKHSVGEYAVELVTGKLYWFGPDTAIRDLYVR